MKPNRVDTTRVARIVAGTLSVAAAVAMAATTLTSASAAINKGAKVTYSKPITVPAPPKGAAGAAGSGDGYDLSFDNGNVYNVFHHQSSFTVDCHVQATGAQCTGFPVKVQGPGSVDFFTSGNGTTAINTTTHHLFSYVTNGSGPLTDNGTTYAKNTAGVLEVDLSPTATNRYVRFIATTPSGDSPPTDPCAANGPGCPMMMVSAGVKVGARFYAINGQPATSTSTTKNQLMCVDLVNSTPCAGQPYDLGLPGSGLMIGLGNRLILTSGGGTPVAYTTTCFDTTTSAVCGGSWPIAKGGPLTPVLDATGTPTGACMTFTDCFGLDGTVAVTPAGLKDALSITITDPTKQTGYGGAPTTVGSRVYLPFNLFDNTNNSAVTTMRCYDYATGAVCPNFPAPTPLSVRLVYTVQADPENPTCLWINSDSGNRIQAIDAYTGGACGVGGSRVMASSLIEPPAGCAPSRWGTLTVTSPTALTSGTVKFQDASGTDLASGSLVLAPSGKTGTLDLSTVTPSLPLTQPYLSMLLDLKDANGAISFAVDAELSWEGTYDDTCIVGGQTVTDGTQTIVGSTTTTVFGATPTTTAAPTTTTTAPTTSTTVPDTTTTVAETTTTAGPTTTVGATTTTMSGSTSTTAPGATTTTLAATTTTAGPATTIVYIQYTGNTVQVTPFTSSTTTTVAPATTAAAVTTLAPTTVPVSVLGAVVTAAPTSIAPAMPVSNTPAYTGSNDLDLTMFALALLAVAALVLGGERLTRKRLQGDD